MWVRVVKDSWDYNMESTWQRTSGDRLSRLRTFLSYQGSIAPNIWAMSVVLVLSFTTLPLDSCRNKRIKHQKEKENLWLIHDTISMILSYLLYKMQHVPFIKAFGAQVCEKLVQIKFRFRFYSRTLIINFLLICISCNLLNWEISLKTECKQGSENKYPFPN